MRTFELSLWLVGASWSAWRLAGRASRRSNAAFAVLTTIAGGLHVALEGVRFHMTPTVRTGSSTLIRSRFLTDIWTASRALSATGERQALIQTSQSPLATSLTMRR